MQVDALVRSACRAPSREAESRAAGSAHFEDLAVTATNER